MNDLDWLKLTIKIQDEIKRRIEGPTSTLESLRSAELAVDGMLVSLSRICRAMSNPTTEEP